MKTFNIQISEDQLKLIQAALSKDPSYNEDEEMLIGMIEDIFEETEEDITHGFCY